MPLLFIPRLPHFSVSCTILLDSHNYPGWNYYDLYFTDGVTEILKDCMSRIEAVIQLFWLQILCSFYFLKGDKLRWQKQETNKWRGLGTWRVHTIWGSSPYLLLALSRAGTGPAAAPSSDLLRETRRSSDVYVKYTHLEMLPTNDSFWRKHAMFPTHWFVDCRQATSNLT